MPSFVFWDQVVVPLAGMATGLIITLAIVKAIARHLERRHEAKGAPAGGDVDGLRVEVRELRGQVESLEERVDFAERLLTQERARRELERGS